MKMRFLFSILTILPLACFATTIAPAPNKTPNISINSSKQLPLPPSMQYRAHPWHGPSLGEKAPEIVNCYLEIAPLSTLKFEMDKETGILKVDRPHKYSSFCPALYGFLPRTYAGKRVAELTSQKTGIPNINGDGDALDIVILADNVPDHGDHLVKARPIGGFRVIDTNEADDKIIAVLDGDLAWGNVKDISECPEKVIDQLRHYFLTYKDMPEKGKQGKMQITHTYGREEALDVIRRSYLDYLDYITPYIQHTEAH